MYPWLHRVFSIMYSWLQMEGASAATYSVVAPHLPHSPAYLHPPPPPPDPVPSPPRPEHQSPTSHPPQSLTSPVGKHLDSPDALPRASAALCLAFHPSRDTPPLPHLPHLSLQSPQSHQLAPLPFQGTGAPHRQLLGHNTYPPLHPPHPQRRRTAAPAPTPRDAFAEPPTRATSSHPELPKSETTAPSAASP